MRAAPRELRGGSAHVRDENARERAPSRYLSTLRPMEMNPAQAAFTADAQTLARTAVLADLRLRNFRPRSRVTRVISTVNTPSVPAIDCHNHLGRWLTDQGEWMAGQPRALVDLMDQCGVERVVNLDGRWGDELVANLERYDRGYPGRFATFCHLDWSRVDTLVAQVDEAAALGARGVKIWKDLGLTVRDPASGTLVGVDDDRVVAAVRRAGEHGLPVLIHTADPVAFFDPLDAMNERVEELTANPGWWFGDRSVFPSFAALIAGLERLVFAAAETSIIGAHVGGYAENLSWVSRMCATYPNFHVDLGGRMAELGRQPRAFGRLVAEHPDRVIFGSDAFPPSAAAYRAWFRFLETDDEYWPYQGEDAIDEVPAQGRWAIHSVGLAPELLHGLYRGNALRLGL